MKINQTKLLLILFFFSGLTSLIYEITWIRPLSLIFGTTIYAVTTIVSSFIFGLAVGSWLASKYIDKKNNPIRYFGFLEVGIGVYGAFLIVIFSGLPSVYLDIFQATSGNIPIFFTVQFLTIFTIISIPTILMGATLPVVLKTYSKEISTIGKDVGRIYSINNIGAVLGTLFAGFLMIPFLGIQLTIIVTAIINVGIGIVVMFYVKESAKYKFVTIGVFVFILGIAFLPLYDFESIGFGIYSYVNEIDDHKVYQNLLNMQDIKFYKEDMYSSVLVVDSGQSLVMKVGGRGQCGSSEYTVKSNQRLGSVPYDLYSDNFGKPKTSLVVGLGCGYTSDLLAKKTETTTIELIPTVVEASKYFVSEINHNLVIDDARNWMMRNDKKFDLIITQPSHPSAGAWPLFTQEYYKLVKERLTEKGLTAQWIPAFEMNVKDMDIAYNTFHSVFPYVYIFQLTDNLQIIFVGSQQELRIDEKYHELITSSSNIQSPNTELNTDDKPIIEFSSALNMYSQNPQPIFEKLVEWHNEDNT